jgi:hypothetical protein
MHSDRPNFKLIRRLSDALAEFDHLLRVDGEYVGRRRDLELIRDQFAHVMRMLAEFGEQS